MPRSLDGQEDQDLEEIPTVLMTRAGSEVLFDDLRERYRRAMVGQELTSPPPMGSGHVVHDDLGFELIEHPTGEIDPLEDYLEMHALASGAYPVVEYSDPHALPSGWGQPYHDLQGPVDAPPPRAFTRAPRSAPPPPAAPPPAASRHSPHRHPSPPAPLPGRVSDPRTLPLPLPAQPVSLRPPTDRGWGTPRQPPVPPPSWADLPPDPGASIPAGWGVPGAPSPPPPSHRHISQDVPYSRAYGRAMPPTHPDELFPSPGVPAPTNPTFPPPRSSSYLPFDERRGPNPHRWDAWILAGFAIGGIWALALIRLFY